MFTKNDTRNQCELSKFSPGNSEKFRVKISYVWRVMVNNYEYFCPGLSHYLFENRQNT